MARVRTIRNILMELRKVCQHPYLSAPELENEDASAQEQHKALTEASGKLAFLKLLLPKLKDRGHRVLLFSQFKIALDMIEDFLVGEGYKFLRLDGDVQQAQRQKSMDAFNAPNSDYFIFLLTTRAGGVGINLATADTVIVYDPDFNPHMDLQAIARSHRYGQKKSTLVFKLMTKNSVEEQIILNGKKKMVLDHLVVQQMGKENEEGDIDNMLLHGAAALYDTNAEGVSASDIRYTSKDVDELINKVEADAIAETKAMEERDNARAANGDASTGTEAGPSKPKETMSFAFAKIWEADSKRIHEMSDDEDEDDRADEDAEAWAIAVENLKKQREAANVDNGQRLRQRQAGVTPKLYTIPQDGALSDDLTDPTPKKGKNGLKGKGKAQAQSDQSDGDFALVPGEESESDDEISALVVDALDIFDIVDGKAVLKEQKMPINVEQAKAAAKAKDVLQTAINDGTVASTAEAVELKKKAKKARKEARKQYQQREIMSSMQLDRSASGQVPAPTPARPPAPPASAQTYGSPVRNAKVLSSAPAATTVQAAQHIVQWLYHVLSNLGLKAEVKMWARMALPEIPGDERGKLYMALAEKADDEMYRRGQRKYFQLPETIDKVIPLLVAGGSVVPGADDVPNTEMPPVPDILGDLRPEAQTYRRQVHVEAPPSPQGTKQYNQHLPSPYHSPQLGSNRKNIAAPAQPPPVLPIAAPAAKSMQSTRNDAPAVPFSAAPGPSDRPQSVMPPANYRASGTADAPVTLTDDGVQIACPICQKAHYLSDCQEIPPVAWLKLHQTKIINSSESERSKVEALTGIERLLKLHEIEANARQIRAARAGLTVNGNTNGHGLPPARSAPRPEEIIVIHDDEGEDDARSTKRARLAREPIVNGSGSPRCLICGAKAMHEAPACPVVLAGSESMKAALKHFTPDHPAWRLLKDLYDRTVPDSQMVGTMGRSCAFCDTACGKTIRQCATDVMGSDFAGRRALKAKIRHTEALIAQGVNVQRKTDELFDVYLKWPK